MDCLKVGSAVRVHLTTPFSADAGNLAFCTWNTLAIVYGDVKRNTTKCLSENVPGITLDMGLP